jgi:quinol monooxygenase YgiN
MIARLWTGHVPRDKRDAYLKLMEDVALREYRATPGNQGAFCLHREEGVLERFDMLTFWRDTDAIRAFAGDDVDLAKYYDFDDDFLVEKAKCVTHFDVSPASSTTV